MRFMGSTDTDTRKASRFHASPLPSDISRFAAYSGQAAPGPSARFSVHIGDPSLDGSSEFLYETFLEAVALVRAVVRQTSLTASPLPFMHIRQTER